MKKNILIFSLVFICNVIFSQTEVYKPYGTVAISEIYYDTPYTEDIAQRKHHLGEFIELFNSSNIDVDMSGWKLTDNRKKIYFPQGTIIKAGGFLVITYTGAADHQPNGNIFFTMFPEIDQSQADNDVFYQSQIVLYNDFDGVLLYNNRNVLVSKLVYKKSTFSVPQHWSYQLLHNNSSADYISTIDNGKSLGTQVTEIPDEAKYSVNIANVDGFYELQSSVHDYTLNPYDPRLEDLPLVEARQLESKIATPHSIPFAVPLLDPSPTIINTSNTNLSYNENYVAEVDFIHQQTTNQSPLARKTNVTYFDELGQAKQIIAVAQSPELNDIFSHIEYDNKGRNIKDYLPTVGTSGNGAFKPDAKSITESYYLQKFGVSNYYTEKKYSNTTSTFAEEMGAPGLPWRITDNITTNSYSNTSPYGKGFPFSVNTNTTSNYDITKSTFDVQIIDDVLYINAKVVYHEPSPLTLNNTTKNITDWLGFTISGTHDLGFVQNEDLLDTPYRITIENGEIEIENTSSGTPEASEYVFNMSFMLSDHKINSPNTFKREIGFNKSSEVPYFYATSSSDYPELINDGFYEEGMLNKYVTKDSDWKENQTFENDHTVIEYKK